MPARFKQLPLWQWGFIMILAGLVSNAEWREAHPSLARRIGAACRSAWRRLSGRDA